MASKLGCVPHGQSFYLFDAWDMVSDSSGPSGGTRTAPLRLSRSTWPSLWSKAAPCQAKFNDKMRADLASAQAAPMCLRHLPAPARGDLYERAAPCQYPAKPTGTSGTAGFTIAGTRPGIPSAAGCRSYHVHLLRVILAVVVIGHPALASCIFPLLENAVSMRKSSFGDCFCFGACYWFPYPLTGFLKKARGKGKKNKFLMEHW